MSAAESSASVGWEKVCSEAISSLRAIDLPEDLQIPSLPTALTEFLELSNSDDYDIRELGQIVEHDPGMTVDLLKCVNSAAFGGAQAIRTPTEALVRLGVPNARNYLMAAGMRSATLVYDSRLMNHRNFWNESLRRALFAQHTARKLQVDVELAFIGGLLQDFVLPVLTNQYDEEYIHFLKEVSPQGVALSDWEWDTFGCDHAAAGAWMAQKWNLPDDLLCAIFLHHKMEVALQAPDSGLFNLFPVNLAALLPDQLCQVPDGVSRLLAADSRSAVFCLDELCREVDSELEQIAEGHDVPLCLAPMIRQAREAIAASD